MGEVSGIAIRVGNPDTQQLLEGWQPLHPTRRARRAAAMGTVLVRRTIAAGLTLGSSPQVTFRCNVLQERV